MVTPGKVKLAMGLQKPPSNPKSEKPPSPSPSSRGKTSTKTTVFNRSFGAYFPRTSTQVQPKPPDVSDLLKLVEELRDRESRLMTELLELKLRCQSAAIVPLLEAEIVSKDEEIERLSKKVLEVEEENEKMVHERELMRERLESERRESERKIAELQSERRESERKIAELQLEIENLSTAQRLQGLIENAGQSNVSKSLTSRKASPAQEPPEIKRLRISRCSSDELPEVSESALSRSRESVVPKPPLSDSMSYSSPGVDGRSSTDEVRSSISRCSSTDEIPEVYRASRIPKPPPTKRPSSNYAASSSPEIAGGNSAGSFSALPPLPQKKASTGPPPPPPPPPVKGMKAATARVKRVPEVVEFYHSFMRRDSRREAGASAAEITATSTRDLVGEIENRSAYLNAIKMDVETQGDLIRVLMKEVETAAFTDIEDVVSFVKWLDDELSYLVDERAVLKHFNWPEQKADALREAAFEYSDLKKLESEALSFSGDARQPCALALKKMQTLLEKLEHGAYNLSRLRESATNRFKSFHIPFDWMLDSGFVSQIKLASVKLAMKYMKRVVAELEAVCGGPEEEELIVQGVRFAFRVHQFAGGFDVETMGAFEELRDKARSGHSHTQCQNQKHQLKN